MTHEQILRIARMECDMASLDRRGIDSIDLGAGWLIIRHTHAEWLVVL